MKWLGMVVFLFVLAGCREVAAPSPHAWERRYDIDRVPHTYLYCTAHGGHEPRTEAEWADALRWAETHAGG